MSHISNLICCPYCQNSLTEDFKCQHCNISFPSKDNQPNLKVTKKITFNINLSYEPEFGYFPWEKVALEWPSIGNGIKRLPHWDIQDFQMLSVVPKVDPTDGLVALDIGCGENRQRFKEGLETLGYTSVGIDIFGQAPDILADAHSLPFKDESFDVIMSSAVFEHLKNPFVAMKELYRVAKPNAKIYLVIAFTEPFHISYFHHSPLAAHELLVINNIHPDKFILPLDWNSFSANLNMGFAGHYLSKSIQKLVAGMILNYALLPAKIMSFIKRDKTNINKAKLAFARSHAGYVGVIAHK